MRLHLGLLLVLATVPAALRAGTAEHFFLVSIDGLRADLVARADTPNLDLLARAGVRAVTARTVRPAVTLPAHASMLSGVEPATHGFLFNAHTPERGYLRRPTLLSAAHQQGRRVAAFLGKKKLLQLIPPGAIDHVEHSGFHDDRVMEKAVAYIGRERPHLTFVHLPDVDAAGHAVGWGSPEQVAALEGADVQLGRLFQAVHAAGLLRRSAFLILADHGGHGTVHGVHHPLEFQIAWVAGGLGFHPGIQIEAPVSVLDTWPTVFAAMGLAPPEGIAGHAIAEALYYADRDLGPDEGPEVGALDPALLAPTGFPSGPRSMDIGAAPPRVAPSAPASPAPLPGPLDRVGLLPPPGWIAGLAARGAL